MKSTVTIVAGKMFYMNLPAAELRNFVDNSFSEFKINERADFIEGANHRFKGGHDILLDIPKTFKEEGFFESANHLGHIVLTDFPTKAGIPIPGFSDTGLGGLLTEHGISAGSLCVNISDVGIDILAFSSTADNLKQAFLNTTGIDYSKSFSTISKGTVKVVVSSHGVEDGTLMASGIADIVAGTKNIASKVIKKFSIYVNPSRLLGSAFTSVAIGIGFSYLTNDLKPDKIPDYLQSGLSSALFSISNGFGYGFMAGLFSFRVGRLLREHHKEGEYLVLETNVENLKKLFDHLLTDDITRDMFNQSLEFEVFDSKRVDAKCYKNAILPSTQELLAHQEDLLMIDQPTHKYIDQLLAYHNDKLDYDIKKL